MPEQSVLGNTTAELRQNAIQDLRVVFAALHHGLLYENLLGFAWLEAAQHHATQTP